MNRAVAIDDSLLNGAYLDENKLSTPGEFDGEPVEDWPYRIVRRVYLWPSLR